MPKITVVSKNDAKQVINQLGYPEAINEQVYNIIHSRVIAELLPLSVEVKGNKTKIKCDVTGFVALKDYYYYEIDKRTFLSVVSGIIEIIDKCEKNFLDPCNLDLSLDRIFFNLKTKSVNCILWPVVNNKSAITAQIFFKELPGKFHFSSREDRQYLNIYSSFFNSLSPFSLTEFKKMITYLQTGKMENDADVAEGKRENHAIAKGAFATNVSIEYDPFANSTNEETKSSSEGKVCACCGSINRTDAGFCFNCGAVYGQELSVTSKENAGIVCDEQSADNEDTLVVFLVDDRIYNLHFSTGCEIRIGDAEGDDLKISGFENKHIRICRTEDSFSINSQGFSQDVNIVADYDEMVLVGSVEKALIYIIRQTGLSDKAVVLPEKCFLTFGRSEDCDVVIGLPFVSGEHFALKRNNGAITVNDSNSRNGLFLNGRKISSAQLESGDKLEILGVKILIDNGVVCFENTGNNLIIKDHENVMLIV